MAIVWPCPLPVDAYVAAGRQVEFPRPDCLSCGEPLMYWSGYWRHVRAGGRCRKIFVPRLLGGEAIRPAAGAGRFALAAIGAAFGAAAGLPGWLAMGRWRFASSVSGGMLIAANKSSPFLVVGRRRFIPPVPPLPA